MNPETQLQLGYELLFERVKSISEDCTEDLERIRLEGARNPMSSQEVVNLLSRCIDEASLGARRRGDPSTAKHLETTKEQIMREVLQSREKIDLPDGVGGRPRLPAANSPQSQRCQTSSGSAIASLSRPPHRQSTRVSSTSKTSASGIRTSG